LSDYIVNYKTQHESIRKSELRKIIKEEIRKLNEASASIDFDSSQKSYKNITIKNETLKKGQMFTKCKLINCTNEGATCIDCI